MPNNAPDVTGAATYKTVSFRLIDSKGELRSVSTRVPVATAPADIQALAVSLGAASNASVYEVQITDRWASIPAAANATDEVVASVYDNIATNMKDVAAGLQQTVYVPAPVGDLILDGDIVDTTDPLYEAWRNNWLVVLAGGYAAVTSRFTERRDKNDSVPA